MQPFHRRIFIGHAIEKPCHTFRDQIYSFRLSYLLVEAGELRNSDFLRDQANAFTWLLVNSLELLIRFVADIE